jgi:two-component system cell cycle response regulator
MRIALAEPSKTVRRIVTGVIEPWGHQICAFTDAPQTLACLEAQGDIRALITSAELATTSGVALVKEARTLAGAQRPLYIILMSSSAERSKMVAALDNGADDFMSKPPAPEELRARLRAADRITSMQAELIALATTDFLTGLLTRRAFIAKFEKMLKRAGADRPLSALVCDMDHFKSINDRYGHDVGDLVLRKVGDELRLLDGPAGRLGGEELAVAVERTAGDAVALAEGLRRAVGGLAIRAGNETVGITCSIGVAQWQPGDTVDALLRRADISLYRAKRGGRDQVVAAEAVALSDLDEGWRGVARGSDRKSG